MIPEKLMIDTQSFLRQQTMFFKVLNHRLLVYQNDKNLNLGEVNKSSYHGWCLCSQVFLPDNG